MKIVINARFLTQPLSGVQRYGIECSRQIKKIYPQAVFVCPPGVLHKDIGQELGVQITGKNTGHLWEQADLPIYLAKNKRPPLLNMANTAPLRYTNNYVTIHDLAFYHHPEWNSRMFSLWYNILVPSVARNSRHIFTVSETVKEEIVKHYTIPPGKISVTYNGVSEAMLADISSHPQIVKKKIILSVGSFNARKNHQRLIKAFLHSRLKNTHQLMIVGDKNKVFAESNINEADLKEGNINICEGFTDTALIDMYRSAEIIVSLSLYEGFGIPLLEGWYYGCKVLCSDIPVYREIYGQQAIFCDPLDIGSIARSLEAIAADGQVLPLSTSLMEKYSYATAARTIIDAIIKTSQNR